MPHCRTGSTGEPVIEPGISAFVSWMCCTARLYEGVVDTKCTDMEHATGVGVTLSCDSGEGMSVAWGA